MVQLAPSRCARRKTWGGGSRPSNGNQDETASVVDDDSGSGTARGSAGTLLAEAATGFLDLLVSTQRRPLVVAIVVVLHALAIYVMLADLGRQVGPKPGPELMLTVIQGGPRKPLGLFAEPVLTTPDEPLVPPPEILVDAQPADTISVSSASGGPGVTMPAEAIGTTRTVPVLSADLLQIARRNLLRLRLTLAADGSVIDAIVENSTGSTVIDLLAVTWVKAHWRYRPAMRDGMPVSVTTTSLVPF